MQHALSGPTVSCWLLSLNKPCQVYFKPLRQLWCWDMSSCLKSVELRLNPTSGSHQPRSLGMVSYPPHSFGFLTCKMKRRNRISQQCCETQIRWCVWKCFINYKVSCVPKEIYQWHWRLGVSNKLPEGRAFLGSTCVLCTDNCGPFFCHCPRG